MRFSRESGAATPTARATHNNSEESHEPILQPEAEPDGPPRGGMDGYSSFLNVASPFLVYGGKRLPMNRSKLDFFFRWGVCVLVKDGGMV